MGYISATLKDVIKKSKFIKITKADFMKVWLYVETIKHNKLQTMRKLKICLIYF